MMFRRRPRAIGAIFPVILAAAAAVLVAAPVAAQRTTSREVVETYNTAMRLLEENRAEEALQVIRKHLESDSLTADERAVLTRFAEQLEAEIRGDINLEDLNFDGHRKDGVSQADNVFFSGRLYLGLDPPDYDKAIEAFREYLESAESPWPEAFFYLAQALSQKREYREALPYAETAAALAEKPEEVHYRLLLNCHVELKNQDEVIRLLKRMIQLFGPKDEFLKALAAAYQKTGRGREACLVQAQRYELGYLSTEEELIGVAELCQRHGEPHRGARILEREMKAGRVRRTAKNYNLLGDLWLHAREWKKARIAWTSHTGRPGGEDELKIARTYLEEHEWGLAEVHLRKSLAKGGLKEPCHAQILLGHTLLNQGKEEEAEKYFALGGKEKACSQGLAPPWPISPYPEYLRIVRGPRVSRFMAELITRLQESGQALADDEDVRLIADEALSSAKAALAAETNKIRQRKLIEYERARFSASLRFDTGVLETAREHRAAAEKILSEARTKDLNGNVHLLMQRLDETSKRRIEVLEEAQAKLEEAERIAARARAKQKATKAGVR